jgi:hypothetical protein
MNFLRSLDLYKAIVLLSLVLLPLGWWQIERQEQDILACRTAIRAATQNGGVLEEIGSLQRKVELVVENKRSLQDAVQQPAQYFEEQIQLAGGAQLKTTDFQPLPGTQENDTLKGKSRQQITDHIVNVTFRKDLLVPMDFVFAVLWNCESGARNSANKTQESVWKLRELQLVNGTDERLIGQGKTPPAGLEDKWSIKALRFARREPNRGTNR